MWLLLDFEDAWLAFCRYADDCNVYVSSQRAADRVLASISQWVGKHLRLEVNATKKRNGATLGAEVSGFRVNPEGKIEAAPQSVERLKDKVRELWRGCPSLSSERLWDNWRAYLQGWWGYYQRAEARRNIHELEGWIRRHARKCFWERWHDCRGRLRALRRLGLKGRMLKAADSSRDAWHMSRTGFLQTALKNTVLPRYGFLVPSGLATIM